MILSGAGKAFSAGGDLKVLKEAVESANPEAFFQGPLNDLNELAGSIRNLPKPVLASIHGFASGAGCSLALSCDLRIAAESARFNLAFIKIGLVPDTGATFLLPRMIGITKATELFLTGEFVDAREAERLGMINRAVPDEKLVEETEALARRLASGPTAAIGQIKMLLQMSTQLTFEHQAELERQVQIELGKKSPDFVEGVTAFLEKRVPEFLGK